MLYRIYIKSNISWRGSRLKVPDFKTIYKAGDKKQNRFLVGHNDGMYYSYFADARNPHVYSFYETTMKSFIDNLDTWKLHTNPGMVVQPVESQVHSTNVSNYSVEGIPAVVN